MKHPIPPEALKRHTAILGMTGSGKSSTGRLMVEEVVAQGHRVCILDTIKSDWWGITSSRTGKSPGLPFKILGGPRGHLPLHSSAGKAIGQLVGTGKLPLSIVDMADFEPGGLQRFFVDFVPALMRSMKGVVYLVIEEAHEVAPKERAGFGAENMAIHFAKKLGTGGRTKGIRLIVLTQRVQALHNAVLGSCETVIAHRIGFADDQVPVLKWMRAKIGKDNAAMVETELANLPDGVGFLASGAPVKLFERVKFPLFSTYDNTTTPEHDDAQLDIKTAPVDADELRAIIGDAVKEAEANDPAKLRAEIARLTVLTKAAPNIPKNIPDANIIAASEQRGYERGYSEAIDQSAGWARESFREIQSILREAIQSADNRILNALNGIPKKKSDSPIERTPTPRPRPEGRPVSKPLPAASGDGTLTPSLQRVINAIGWWRKIGFDPIERARASVVAGFSPKASTFGVYVAQLVTLGLVSTSQPGKVGLTDEGVMAAVVPEAGTAEELHTVSRSLLGAQEAKVFDVIYNAYPNEIARKDVAEQVGLSPTASTTGVYIAGVAAFGIIEVSSPGHVRAAEWMFP